MQRCVGRVRRRALGVRWKSGDKGDAVRMMGLRGPTELDVETMRRLVQEREKKASIKALRESVPAKQEQGPSAAQQQQVSDSQTASHPGAPVSEEEAERRMSESLFVQACAFTGMFVVVVSTAHGILFTLCDAGVPFPMIDLTGRRKKQQRDPLSVTMSYSPLLVVPSLILSYLFLPFAIHVQFRYLRRTARELGSIFNTSRLGSTTALRQNHESGVNRLVLKSANPHWNEKGLDTGVIMGTKKMD
ncbi:hypothetical protein DIPPA_25768 [Diplonema papillatum]|nr:hypothetical protein DIPPA_25768 [Diplonema papillatum]